LNFTHIEVIAKMVNSFKKHFDKFRWLKERRVLPYQEYMKLLTTMSTVFVSKVEEYFKEVENDY